MLASGTLMSGLSHMQPTMQVQHQMADVARGSNISHPSRCLNTIPEVLAPPSGCLDAHGVCKALHGAVPAAARGLLDEAQELQLPACAAEAHRQVLQCCSLRLHNTSQCFRTRL